MYIRESVDSLCRDGADTPMPPYIGKAFTRTNFEDLSSYQLHRPPLPIYPCGHCGYFTKIEPLGSLHVQSYNVGVDLYGYHRPALATIAL